MITLVIAFSICHANAKSTQERPPVGDMTVLEIEDAIQARAPPSKSNLYTDPCSNAPSFKNSIATRLHRVPRRRV